MRDCTEVLRGSATILMVGDPRLFLYFFLGRPLVYVTFSLIGLKRTLFTNIFQRL